MGDVRTRKQIPRGIHHRDPGTDRMCPPGEGPQHGVRFLRGGGLPQGAPVNGHQGIRRQNVAAGMFFQGSPRLPAAQFSHRLLRGQNAGFIHVRRVHLKGNPHLTQQFLPTGRGRSQNQGKRHVKNTSGKRYPISISQFCLLVKFWEVNFP